MARAFEGFFAVGVGLQVLIWICIVGIGVAVFICIFFCLRMAFQPPQQTVVVHQVPAGAARVQQLTQHPTVYTTPVVPTVQAVPGTTTGVVMTNAVPTARAQPVAQVVSPY